MFAKWFFIFSMTAVFFLHPFILQTDIGATNPPVLDAVPFPDAPHIPQIDNDETITRNLQSLEALRRSLESKAQNIRILRERLQTNPDEITRKELLDQLSKEMLEQEHLRLRFERFAVGIDIGKFIEIKEEAFDWQDELFKLIKPILAEFKSATAESRKIGELRADVQHYGELAGVAVKALEQLEKLLQADPPDPLKTDIAELAQLYRQRLDNAKNQELAAQKQLDMLLAKRKSVLDSTTGFAQNFMRNRGLNLLLGIASFCAFFFGVRGVYLLWNKIHYKRTDRTFSTRLAALIFQLVSVFGGVFAMLIVFNIVSDWFLMALVLVFLIGVGWAGIKTLPQQMDTIKLVLNTGSVREGERLEFQGMPWKVDKLGFWVQLVNPLLDGGKQLLPVKFIVGMHSRPFGRNEVLFPCRLHDWVELADGRIGQVTEQNPAMVQLTELGGARIVYQTSHFLSLSPRNLSTNFRLETVFGVDYRHQSMATTQIPAKMKDKLTAEMPALVPAEQILHISVEFMQAAASALEYRVEIDFDGAAAALYKRLQHAMQRILVDACTENGWDIPFTQVTLHTAKTQP
jgi:hypothetical protein